MNTTTFRSIMTSCRHERSTLRNVAGRLSNPFAENAVAERWGGGRAVTFRTFRKSPVSRLVLPITLRNVAANVPQDVPQPPLRAAGRAQLRRAPPGGRGVRS